MDSIAEKIQQFLSDPSAAEQIQQMMSSLGVSDNTSGEEPDFSALLGMFAGGNTQNSTAAQGFDMAGIAGIVSALQGGDNDQNAKLLMAIKPFLSDKRRRKVGEAVQLMRAMRMLPYLKDLGIMGFGEGEKNV